MVLICINIYLNSVLRHRFLILDPYIPDTLYLCEQGLEDLWLFFEAKRGREQKFLETLVYPVLINKHLKVQSLTDDSVSVVDEKLHAIRPIWTRFCLACRSSEVSLWPITIRVEPTIKKQSADTAKRITSFLTTLHVVL